MSAPVRLHGSGCSTGIYASNPDLLDHLQGLVSKAIAKQGPKALELPQGAAAHHEAGHAVIAALEGDGPVRVRIKRIATSNGTAWIGLTTRRTKVWHVGPDTDPLADLCEARFQLAGWCAEQLFERDPRLASSLDECVIAGGICQTVATKLDRQPEAVLNEQLVLVFGSLKAHERHVRAIAAALLRHRILRGIQLARLLP